MEPASVDLVFADPPFNIGYDYDVYHDRHDSQQYLDWTRVWGKAVHRVLKPNGTFWLAIGDDYAANLKLIFQNDLGFSCRSWVIWYYTFGINCTKKFSRSHTHLFHFVQNPKKFTFNSLEIRVPSARQVVYADSRADSSGRLPDDTWILRPQDLPDGFQPDENTWYFPRVCGTFKERAGWHGCQMPEQVLGRIIRACSNPSDLVLDPFAGSGTTLVVAKKLGRRWIGFELSRNYVARVQARLNAVQEGQALEGAEEPKVGAPPTPSRTSKVQPSNPVVPILERDHPVDFKQGIIEAFFAVRKGFPADRIIADPELNERFIQACRRLGLPGQPWQWNHQLMNLRKAGVFKGLPRSKKSGLTLQEIDDYGFACEIALQHLKEEERTLDSVLCSPEKAAEFDRYVRSMIPDDISPFKIRWLALHIRKRAKTVRQAGRELRDCLQLPRKKHRVCSLSRGDLSPTPGLYWLQSPEEKLYVGETLDLRRRFQLQFEKAKFEFWGTDWRNLELRYCELPNVEEALLKGNQSRWIARWKPVGNYSDFAAL